MKKMTKLLAMVLAVMFVMAAFAGCGNDSDEKDTDGNEQDNNEARNDVIIATANEPPTLHPYDHNATAANYMNALTYDTLYRTNLDTLEPEPSLVTGYELLSDTEWKFTLREGVKFHNGETMTADDVKASMEYAKNDYSALTNIYTSWWSNIEVVDAQTFIITTNDVYAKTLNDLTRIKVVPKSLIDSGNDFNQNPVGSGPYKFVNWTLGDSLSFEAFEEYWGGAPAIKEMTWRIIPEGSSRTIALEAGEIDFIVEVETNDLSRLETTEGISVVNQTGTNFTFMMINNEVAPFDNQDFRHALNCAVDKDSVVEVALNGAGTGIFWQTPSVLSGYSEENLDSYDLELAKQHLEASGIDPSTVTFSCICSDDTKRRAGEVIQASLQELGITMELESMDLATYLSVTAEGDYEAAIGGYTSSDMMSFIEGVFHSKSINGSNLTRTNDPEIDSLYDLATTQLDAAERTATLEQCSSALNVRCPQVPLYQTNVVRAYNSDLQGVKVSASGTMRWQDVSWAE